MLKIELEIECDIAQDKSPFIIFVRDILTDKAIIRNKKTIIIRYPFKKKPLYTIKIKKAEQI